MPTISSVCMVHTTTILVAARLEKLQTYWNVDLVLENLPRGAAEPKPGRCRKLAFCHHKNFTRSWNSLPIIFTSTIPRRWWYHTNHTNHRHQHLSLHSLQHHIKLMVQAYHHTSPTPRLGMLAPPPLLFTANRKTLPNETQPPGCTNDQASSPTLIPKLAVPVTVLADASSSEDEGSLSDASSYRDFSAAVARPKNLSLTSRSSTTTNHTGGTMPASTRNLPLGRPLRAKPRIFKRRASYKAGVPQKLPVQHSGKQASTPSPTILQRSCYLSQDEKLFLEAAATLAQASRE